MLENTRTIDLTARPATEVKPTPETLRRDETWEPSTTRRPPAQTVTVFQLDQARIQIDHCRISSVALQLLDDGQWVLNLRAEQNPPVEDETSTYRPRLHLKRNQFVIRLRALPVGERSGEAAVRGVGRPVLAAIEPPPFWVEREQPKSVRLTGRDNDVWRVFDMIDRVEFEFYYR
ncbi:MAG: hypothetical protein QGG36_27655 [Pirellulaceae bacterium]|nr:hypothetical protein [Pirellulaceae bacterium]